jgi:hypothetical protein
MLHNMTDSNLLHVWIRWCLGRFEDIHHVSKVMLLLDSINKGPSRRLIALDSLDQIVDGWETSPWVVNYENVKRHVIGPIKPVL